MWRVHREVTNETYAVSHTMTLTTWANKTSLYSLRRFNCLNNKQYNVFNYKTNQKYKDTKVLIHSANKTLKMLFTLTVPLYFLRKKRALRAQMFTTIQTQCWQQWTCNNAVERWGPVIENMCGNRPSVPRNVMHASKCHIVIAQAKHTTET